MGSPDPESIRRMDGVRAGARKVKIMVDNRQMTPEGALAILPELTGLVCELFELVVQIAESLDDTSHQVARIRERLGDL